MTALLRPRALVVDDEPLILMAAVEMLESAGLPAGEFGSADAAMVLLERCADDIVLVFTDVEMPGTMDGLTFARRIAERWPHIAIIVASGSAWPSESELPGAAMFLPKPYSDSDVERALRCVAVA